MNYISCRISDAPRETDVIAKVVDVDKKTYGVVCPRKDLRRYLDENFADGWALPVWVIRRDPDRTLVELPRTADNRRTRLWVTPKSLVDSFLADIPKETTR